MTMVLLVIAAVGAVVALLWWLPRWARQRGGAPLTRVTQLVPDEGGRWLHVFGVHTHQPEHGDTVSTCVHLMVEARTGRWLAGAREPGDEVRLDGPFVARSLESLAGAVGAPPRLGRGGALPRRRGDGPITLVITKQPSAHVGPALPHTATLFVGDAVRATHDIRALDEPGFVTRLLDQDRVALFSYVTTRLGDLEAHLVALDLDSGAVLFDRPCAAPGG